MSPVLPLLLSVACMGVEVGWRPLPDGGTEYVIRVSPEELADLQLGDIIAASDVPADVQPIRSYRVEVGRGPVERQNPNPNQASSATPNSPELPANAGLEGTAPPGISPPSSAIPLVFTQPAGPGPMADPATGSAPDQNPGKSQDTTQSGLSTTPIEPSTQSGHGRIGKAQQNGEKESPEHEVNSNGSLINTLALSGMTASFAAVVYVGWVAWEYRRKYLELLRSGSPIMQWEGRDDSAAAAGPPSSPMDRVNESAAPSPTSEPEPPPADPPRPLPA